MQLKLLGARIMREERTQCKVMLWSLGDGTFRIIGIERQSFQEDLSTQKAALPRAGVRCILYIQLYIVRASQRTIKKGFLPLSGKEIQAPMCFAFRYCWLDSCVLLAF